MLVALAAWMSPRDALAQMGCMSFNARLAEYRAAGILLEEEWMQDGPGPARFKRHRLAEGVGSALAKWRGRPKRQRRDGAGGAHGGAESSACSGGANAGAVDA